MVCSAVIIVFLFLIVDRSRRPHPASFLGDPLLVKERVGIKRAKLKRAKLMGNRLPVFL